MIINKKYLNTTLVFSLVTLGVILFFFKAGNLALASDSLADSIKTSSEKIPLSGSTRFRYSVDTDDNGTNENQTSFLNRTIIELDYHKFILSAVSDYLYFGANDRSDDYHFAVHELIYRHSIKSLDISLGKQVRRWGKTDQISPVDTLNPENKKEFILPSYEDRQLPVWIADIIFRHKDFFIEGVFIPFFEPSRVDYFGTDWALFSHFKKDIKDSSLPSFFKSYFDSIKVHETKPDNGFSSFEYAVRVGGTMDRFDFAFTYHYANEDKPFFISFPVKNLSLKQLDTIQSLIDSPGNLMLTNENIETTFLRTHHLGFEFETVVSDFGVRGEAVVKDNESFLTGALTSLRNPSLFWVIGVDYLSYNQWYVNLQFSHHHIFEYNPSILYYEKNNYSIFGEIKKNLISDWLQAGIQFIWILNDNSHYFSPQLTYTYIKNLEVSLGLNIFEGGYGTIMGRYDENDQVFLKLKYYF